MNMVVGPTDAVIQAGTQRLTSPFPFWYAIRVAGTKFHLKDNARLISDDVWVDRVENEIDANAVGVWNICDGAKEPIFMGYLPKEMSAVIGQDCLPKRGKIVWRDLRLGVRIMVS